MNSSLPILYLSVLLILLASAGFTILRQVLVRQKWHFSATKPTEIKRPEDYYQLGGIYLDKNFTLKLLTSFRSVKAGDAEPEEFLL